MVLVKARKWIGNILFLILVLGATLWLVFREEDVGAVWDCVMTASPLWTGIAATLVILFILSESVILRLLMKAVGQPARITHCFLYSFTGFFFSCITPSASGGQPMQVWLMRRDGIPAAVSVPLLIVVTILYKLVLVVVGLAVLLIRPAAVFAYLAPAEAWFWLGIALNIGFVVLSLILVFRPERMRPLVRWLVGLWGRIRPKKRDDLMQRAEDWIDRYRDVAATTRKKGATLWICAGITLLQRILLFAVTWCGCMAFHVGQGQMLLILTLQAMIAVAADMMPLPGGSGISEGLFLRLFTPLLGETLTLPIMVFSRGIGFYAQILIGGIFTVLSILLIRPKKET